MPSRITYNQITPPMVLPYYMHTEKKRKRERKKKKTKMGIITTQKEEKRKKRRKKNEANMRSGRRPSPEDKITVCWYDQSNEMSSRWTITGDHS